MSNPDELAVTARRRLEQLGRELELARVGPAASTEEPVLDLEPTAIPLPGRHSRARPGSGLLDLLPATLRGRIGLRWGHVAVLVGLVGLALAVTALVVLRSSPEGVAVAPPRPVGPLVSAVPAGAPSGASSVAPAASATSGTVVVDVAGKVRRPGVTTLPAGSRVVDAIRKAGGARAGVDLSGINLARVLVDGEQILVGQQAAPGAASSAASEPGAPDTGPLVNLNSATEQQLEALPGVGPVTAGKIVSWRQAHGAFSNVDDLLEVDGIGEKTLAEIAPHVTL